MRNISIFSNFENYSFHIALSTDEWKQYYLEFFLHIIYEVLDTLYIVFLPRLGIHVIFTWSRDLVAFYTDALWTCHAILMWQVHMESAARKLELLLNGKNLSADWKGIITLYIFPLNKQDSRTAARCKFSPQLPVISYWIMTISWFDYCRNSQVSKPPSVLLLFFVVS